jgi:hypothetical protein
MTRRRSRLSLRAGAPLIRFGAILVLLLSFGNRAVRAAEGAPAGERGDKKNLKMLGLSFLLPGLAQFTHGEKTRGAAFMAVEGGIWTGYAAFRIQGGIRKDSYIEMAKLHAGVRSPKGESDEYYRLLGNWPSSELYDEYVVAMEGRTLYPDDLEARAAYVEAHRIPDDRAWAWESQSAWDRYRQKRNDSRASFRRGRNMIAFAVANRVVAALDAALFLRTPSAARTVRLEMVPGETPFSAELRLSCALP